MNAPARPFPWSSLPRVPRTVSAAGRAARRAVARALEPARVAQALGALTAASVSVTVHDVTVARSVEAMGAIPAARVGLRLADDTAELLVAVDPALATDVLRRVLARPVGLDAPGAPWSPALQGAFEAIVLELARQVGAARGVAVAVPPVLGAHEAPVLVRATVTLEGRPYAAAVLVAPLVSTPCAAPEPQRIGALSVALPLVVGVAATSRAELAQLRPGDAWTCGEGWTVDARGVGTAVLLATGREVGVLVDLAPDGSIVVRGEERHVPLDEVTMGDPNPDETTLVMENVLDAPLVVRVELGQVSLSVREWAALAPGDVLCTGQQLAGPVRLAVGGREVARGELVDVDGEVGVRITALTGEVAG